MKHLKFFESFNNNIDIDLFLDYLQDIIDNHTLSKIDDRTFLKRGYMFITPYNFIEGYYYNITNHNDVFYIDINILKKASDKYPEYHSIDYKESPLKKEFPNLYYDILEYVKIIKKIFPKDDYLLNNSLRAYLINGYKLRFYEIKMQFEIRELKYEETEHYKTKKFLSNFNFTDDEKKKLKEIGYNIDESLKIKNFTIDDIIKCIRNKGYIYATIINNFPDNSPEEPLNPMSVDDDGLITVEIDGEEYEVELKNVDKIQL
jgi:hypothetical protein